MADPDKFGYHAVECYRLIGDDDLAAMHAREIIRKSTAPDGTIVAPMRAAETTLTLGVAAAPTWRSGTSIEFWPPGVGYRAKVETTPTHVGAELDRALTRNFQGEDRTRQFHDALIDATT